jgi:1-acyl-sn-glycerol-3-phosphate acyltransferase
MGDPAVVAPPHPVAATLFARYTRRLLATHYAAVHLGGETLAPEGPGRLLFVANHSNWWDGFLAVLLTARLGLHFNILMEARHLERYWMFKRVGALPMHRDSAPAAYADLVRAAGCLRRDRSALWVFPQGKRQPAAAPIAGTERGAAALALSAGPATQIVPVAFRYAFLGEQLPEAFVWVGQPWSGPGETPPAGIGPAARRERRRDLARQIERRLEATLARVDAALATEQLDAFQPVLEGRLSVNKRLDRVRHALGMVDGEFRRRNG